MHTLFISDLHLAPERPQITAQFLGFVRDVAPQAQALYILGDLFEYWAGDDDDDALGAQVAAALKVLAGGGTDAPWELVGDGFGFTDGACGDTEGNFYFSDLPKGLIYRVAAGATKAEPWLTTGPKVSGLKFGPDGRLYAATQGESPKIVAIIRRPRPSAMWPPV